MQGYSQIWLWIFIAAIVGLFLLRRGRHRPGGFGHGGSFRPGDDGHHHHQRDDQESGASMPEAVTDPVSGAAVSTASAISTIYKGRAYYFSSKNNRDLFEAAPADYAAKTQGVALGRRDEDEARHHRPRRGC